VFQRHELTMSTSGNALLLKKQLLELRKSMSFILIKQRSSGWL